MQFSLRQLRYVVAAAEAGNLTEAARHLGVSQPSVSSAIAELETAVGASLFVRHHARGVALTPVGERIVNEARLLLKHASDFGQSARELSGALKGEIVVGCFLTLAVRFMPVLLARFGVDSQTVTISRESLDAMEARIHSEEALLSFGRAVLGVNSTRQISWDDWLHQRAPDAKTTPRRTKNAKESYGQLSMF